MSTRTSTEAPHASTEAPHGAAARAHEPARLATRPKRADARRNYDKLIAAARAAFTEADRSASLEDIFAVRDRDSELFRSCRTAFVSSGVPLLERAQAAGVVRADMTFDELLWMVGGISKIPAGPAEIERVLSVALDGLRYRPE